MDYHADRFQDCSFLVYKSGKPEAVIPGNKVKTTFYTHQGLTYGGVVSTEVITASDMLEVFKLLREQLMYVGCETVVYKPVPAIYHKIPAEEELYALFRNNAILITRQISSAIRKEQKIPFTESRARGIRKALQAGVNVCESTDIASFWDILEATLLKQYNSKPVHSREEIVSLSQKFPQEICLHVGILNEVMVAGVVVYLTNQVAHVQYIGASEEGKRCGALDLIFDHLIHHQYKDVSFFDFGTSNEQGGEILNEGLIFQKEGFGGRGVVYDVYQFDVSGIKSRVLDNSSNTHRG